MKLLLVTLLAFSSPAFSCSKSEGGILPKNNLRIPVNAKRTGGLTEAQFNEVITKVETYYKPIVKTYGGNLIVVRDWTNAEVNAYAERESSDWKVRMFGGLARHETITLDGMALVVCHEIGHHIGGSPVKTGRWAATEGQSDYFGTSKCLRRVWEKDDNEEAAANLDVPAFVKTACGKSWAMNRDYFICLRSAMAGLSLSNLFAASNITGPLPVAKFHTPDPAVVASTYESHPKHQCRLDTYFEGSLCEISKRVDFTVGSETKGACHEKLGHKEGLRPHCWYKSKE